MPLPLVPALILATSVLTGGTGVYKSADAALTIKRARARYDQRRSAYEVVERRYVAARESAQTTFDRLGRRRLEALVTLGRAVEFLKKARVKDRELERTFDISPEQLAAWEGASISAGETLSGLLGAAGAGIATASAAYGLVGTFAAASTGTAISSLSGAAAANATLAWLGGGSIAAGGGGMALGGLVLNGVIAGPALLVAGFFAARKAEEVETEIARQFAMMDVAEAEMDQQLAVVGLAIRRANELHEATDRVDTALSDMIRSHDPSNIDHVYEVARTAKALGSLLDVAILNSDGTISTD